MKKLLSLVVILFLLSFAFPQPPDPKTAELAVSLHIDTYSLLEVSANTLTFSGIPPADDALYPASECPVVVFFQWVRDGALAGVTNTLTLHATQPLLNVLNLEKGINVQNALKSTCTGDWSASHFLHLVPDVEYSTGNHVGSREASYQFEYLNNIRPDGGGDFQTTLIFTLTSE